MKKQIDDTIPIRHKLQWIYSKDIPIPLDGKKRWIAYHSVNEDIDMIKEVFCDQTIIPTITDTIRYYAWTDDTIVIPEYVSQKEQC